MQEVREAGRSEAPLLSLRQWVLLSSPALRGTGAAVLERKAITGHGYALSEPFAPSIGLWGTADHADLVGTGGALCFVREGTYYKFKQRWRLKTGRQFAAQHGAAPWAVATCCLVEYLESQRRFDACASVGVAAAHAAPRVGVLPIEVVLHLELMRRGFTALELTPTEWLQMSEEQRTTHWWGTNGSIAEIFSELHRYTCSKGPRDSLLAHLI